MSLINLIQEIIGIEPSDFINIKDSFTKLFNVYEEFQKDCIKDLDWSRLMELEFDSFLVKLLAYQVENPNSYTNIFMDDIDNEKSDAELLVETREQDDGSEDFCNRRYIFTTYFIGSILRKISSLQFKNDDLMEFNKRMFDKDLVGLLTKYFRSRFFKRQMYLSEMIIFLLDTYKQLSENFSYQRDKFNLNTVHKLYSNCSDDYTDKYTVQLNYNLKSNSLEKCLENLRACAPELLCRSEGNERYHDLITLVNIVNKPQFKDYNMFKKHRFDDIFMSISEYIYENKEDLTVPYYIEKKGIQPEFYSKVSYYGPIESTEYETNFQTISHFYPQPFINKVNKLTDIFNFLLIILNNVIYSSIECNLTFSSQKMISKLVSFISDLDYLSKFENNPTFMIYLLSTLSVMSKLSEEHMDYWNECKVVKVLIKLDAFYTDKTLTKDIINYIYNCLGYIADDKKLETLEKITPFVKTLLEYLQSIADSIKSSNHSSKIKTEVYNNKKEIVEVEVTYFNKSVIGILHQLTRFALNSKLKLVIFEKFNTIKTILYNCNEIEKFYVLKLIAQLCFSEENADDIQSDKEFIDFIKNLSEKSKECQFDITKVCENILMSLKLIKNEPIPVAQVSSSQDSKPSIGHIMISYNWSTQELCLKIRDELVKNGYKVWIDVDEMSNCILDSMAAAVEKSSVVLICVCEKYKLSENCQLEAKYAHKLKKNIIPIIMQLGYEKVDGWLGILLSDRLFVNFMKKPFDVCFQGLKSEIDKKFKFSEILPLEHKPPIEKPKETKISEEIKPSKSLAPEEWDSDKVNEWLIENNLPESLSVAYGKIDGDSLKQLYEIYCKTPEFFYQALAEETNNQLKLSEVSMFISKLKKLFKNSQ